MADFAGLDDEGADDSEVISHGSVYRSVLVIHGKDHAMVHLNQSFL